MGRDIYVRRHISAGPCVLFLLLLADFPEVLPFMTESRHRLSLAVVALDFSGSREVLPNYSPITINVVVTWITDTPSSNFSNRICRQGSGGTPPAVYCKLIII